MTIKSKCAEYIVTSVKHVCEALLNDEQKIFLYSCIHDTFNPNKEIVVITQKLGKDITFYCPTVLLAWLAKTLLTKEPETIEWIDGFEKDSILWDIGANIGCYSLYAGMNGIRTYAFEPQSANYYILNQNIKHNKLDKIVSAYCVALSKENSLATMNLSSLEFGDAFNLFGSPTDRFESAGSQYAVDFQQGMIGFSIDQFIEQYAVEVPNYIKIDVDGIEDKIISGARKTLSHPGLRSVLVELDENDSKMVHYVSEFLSEYDFYLASKRHSEIVENGPWKHIYNYIFFKKNDQM